MKRKICFVTIAVMVLSLIGCGSKESTDDASAQEEKQNKAKIEEAMENEDYDKAKTLTANDSNYKDLYKDLEAYLMVVNDIQMRYVHAKFDDSEDSEFEECAEKLEGIPNEYKKYSKFKAKIKLYKEELQKAISLEKKFRKKYDKLNDPYKEGKVLKNESDFDDWIRVLPDEVSVVSTQTAVKNSLKEVLQRFDTAYGKERRIEADLGGFAIVLFGDRTEVFEQEKNVLKYFKLNADEYEYEEIYKQKEPECTVEVTFRLYLCSSDYAVQVVRVLKKENENG